MTDQQRNRFAGLQKSFIATNKGSALTDAIAEKVGNYLLEQQKAGKSFTVKSVANYIRDTKLHDCSSAQHPDSAMRTVARRVLINLGVIAKPEKKAKPVNRDSETPVKN